MTTTEDKPRTHNIETNTDPIEVWLSQKNLAVSCRIVWEDETTGDYDSMVDSLSIRGAQREVSGWLIGLGYSPAGRWEYETPDPHQDALPECSRRFQRSKP